MTIIYVLTDGSYSDYHIEAVCSTKEIADQLHDRMQWDIEEFEIDEFTNSLKPGNKNYTVSMDRNGDSTIKEAEGVVTNKTAYRIHDKKLQYLGDGKYDVTHKSWMICWVTTKSETHAVKIANELRAQLIASGEWKPSRDD